MANVNVSLESGLVQLSINTGNNTVLVQNADPSQTAAFNVFNAAVLNGNAAGSVIVWSYRQAPGTSNTIPIPTTDNNGTAINWQVGNVTPKGSTTPVQTIVSPPWQLTMA